MNWISWLLRSTQETINQLSKPTMIDNIIGFLNLIFYSNDRRLISVYFCIWCRHKLPHFESNFRYITSEDQAKWVYSIVFGVGQVSAFQCFFFLWFQARWNWTAHDSRIRLENWTRGAPRSREIVPWTLPSFLLIFFALILLLFNNYLCSRIVFICFVVSFLPQIFTI